MQTKRKAFAYITQGTKLLVFEQPDSPEAGIQVPAGSINGGESPQVGALREAQEETGLENFTLCCFFGEQIRDMRDYGKDEIHHRYFYHLLYEDETPETWLHGEFSPSDEPEHNSTIWRHRFEFYWLEIDEIPQLIAEHGYFLPTLQQHLYKNANP